MGWGFRLFRRLFLKAEDGAKTSLFLAYESSASLQTGGYYVKCAYTQPSREAQDDRLATALWEKSMNLLDFVWDNS